jgi:hypothetical protein
MLDLIVILLIGISVRFAFRRFLKHVAAPPDPQECCPCGYILENLSMPRCPECGRVIGFNATAEELGLTDEELLRAHAAKIKRKSQGTSQEEPRT